MVATVVRFGECLLDLERRELRRASSAVHLTPKAFELLALLARERPRALAKHEITAALWPGSFVSEGSLSVLVAELRRALGDAARAPRYLRTVHGYGFAFCAETQEPREAEAAALCRIVVWGLREFRLGDGQAVIGRDPGCEVPIDLATLSRRHARLTVKPGMAVFEDLESKNGSTVNGERVRQPLALAEGDEIRVGSALLSFHWLPHPERSNTVTSPRRPG